jgi:acetyltransferase-like isoleucine patch superfamily enzyme
MISWGVTVVDHNSHALNARDRLPDIPAWREGKKDWSKVMIAPVRIRDSAWIGFNAIILKGVTVGKGAVVSAGAVVAQDVPDYAVVMGNPAPVIHFTDPL